MRVFVLPLLVVSLSAQVAQKANERYQSPEARKGMIATLTDPSRDARQKPKELIAQLGIEPGMTVVDLGPALVICCLT